MAKREPTSGFHLRLHLTRSVTPVCCPTDRPADSVKRTSPPVHCTATDKQPYLEQSPTILKLAFSGIQHGSKIEKKAASRTSATRGTSANATKRREGIEEGGGTHSNTTESLGYSDAATSQSHQWRAEFSSSPSTGICAGQRGQHIAPDIDIRSRYLRQ